MLRLINFLIILSAFIYLSLRSWEQLIKDLTLSLKNTNNNQYIDDTESKKKHFIASTVTLHFSKTFYLTFAIVSILIAFIYTFGTFVSHLAKSTNDLNMSSFEGNTKKISIDYIVTQLWNLLSMFAFNSSTTLGTFALTIAFCLMYDYLFISVKNSYDIYSMRIHLNAVMVVIITINIVSLGIIYAMY